MSMNLRDTQTSVSAANIFLIAAEVFALLDTPRSLGMYLRIKYECWDEVAHATISPHDYNDSFTFQKDYQAVSLLRKAEFLNTSGDRREAANAKFFEAEESCRKTNERIFDLMDLGPGVLGEVPNSVLTCVNNARTIIRAILSDEPSMEKLRFGPGSTSLVSRTVTLPNKYSHELHVSPELYCYWRDVAGPLWASKVHNIELRGACTISHVPKDAKTDRTIGIEPHLNIYAQLGIGGALRRRLSPWICLNTGQEVNKKLASVAHSEELSTIDFSSASDTISRSVVWLLLPEKWVMLMDRVRSHRYLLNEQEYVFHKHSSMGNGYTFELESIIFYALARAACGAGHRSYRGDISVYGDDVILPRKHAKTFIEVCEFLGFTVNRDKSFLAGSFFESCGSDFFNGVNVRPVFWKTLRPTTIFKVHNDVSRMAETFGNPAFLDLAKRIRETGPTSFRNCLIPQGYGDIGYVVPFDVACPSIRKLGKGWCGFKTKALKYVPSKRDYGKTWQGYLSSLDTDGETSLSPVRGRGVWMVQPFDTFGDWVH